MVGSAGWFLRPLSIKKKKINFLYRKESGGRGSAAGLGSVKAGGAAHPNAW